MFYGGYGYFGRGLQFSDDFMWQILLIAIPFFLCLGAQILVKSRYRRFSRVMNSRGLTGAQAAYALLQANGVRDVQIMRVTGSLTDHYDPTRKVVSLSDATYGSTSVAAIGVAAHECGHVIQHATGYAPLKLRSAMVPMVSFSNNIVQWVLLAGIMIVQVTPALLWLGIALFAFSTLFSFVTLPVEVNASQRAVNWLESAGITNYETRPMAIDALRWAAYTYIIAAIGSLATLLYYIGIADRR